MRHSEYLNLCEELNALLYGFAPNYQAIIIDMLKPLNYEQFCILNRMYNKEFGNYLKEELDLKLSFWAISEIANLISNNN